MQSAIILAAGDGKRMKSEKPKVLAEVLMQPMLEWVTDSVKESGISEIGVVVGNGAELVTEFLEKKSVGCRTFIQSERKGTGHAVMQAAEMLEKGGDVLVLCGDAPFIDSDTITQSYRCHSENGNAVTVVTAELENPASYGRIIRENGEVRKIVEYKDCTPEQAAVREINSGTYWFSAEALKNALPKISSANASGEYYLTDAFEIIGSDGGKMGAFKAENPDIVLGANSRTDLLALNTKARMKKIAELLDGGVEFVCTDGIIIGKNVKIGNDTKILPNTVITGNTVIGNGCVIGSNSRLSDCTVGNGVILDNVHAYESVIDDGAKAGPFVHLRPNTHLHSGVKIGDFVEVKNSEIGVNTCIAHLTYVGDSDVGKGVNFGCGCVTANYDGIKKYRTKIGDNAFIGCNTNLIAPVEVGDNASTAAGSTITKNVPPEGLAIERGDVRVIENWPKNKKRIKKA